jgi:hypothetical protein
MVDRFRFTLVQFCLVLSFGTLWHYFNGTTGHWLRCLNFFSLLCLCSLVRFLVLLTDVQLCTSMPCFGSRNPCEKMYIFPTFRL